MLIAFNESIDIYMEFHEYAGLPGVEGKTGMQGDPGLRGEPGPRGERGI